MNLIDKQVVHKSFGEGNVVACNDSYIEVRFPKENKKFVFPDALGTHLVLVDQKVAAKADEKKHEILKERKEKEEELEKIKAVEEEKRQRFLEREKMIKNHKLSPVSQAAFWLNEDEYSTVFSEWKVFTGVRKSGPNEGKPNRLIRLHQNSACLITAREPDMPERGRHVLGIFMVDETFVGKLCESGYIPAHEDYRLRLTDEESQKILFWNYYINKRYPENMTWNNGRYRYFDNIWMAQILKDIIALKKDPEEQKHAQDFYEYFCHMNRLTEEDIPKPAGPLVNIANNVG